MSPNYYLNFIRKNLELSKDYFSHKILNSFTQYETRLLEQAFKNFIKPELNGEGAITFPVNWDPFSNRKSLLGSRAFKAITKKGLIYEFASINSGSLILGVSRKTIETLMNFSNNYIFCPSIGLYCKFIEEGLPLKENSASPYNNPYLRSDFEGVDYNSLPLEVIVAFNRNLEIVGKFQNSKEAANQCGLINYYRVSRHINKNFVKAKIKNKEMEVLFAQNPLSKGSSRKVVMENFISGTFLLFPSFNELVRYFELDPIKQGGNSTIRQCLIKGTTYKNSYKFYYLKDFYTQAKNSEGIIPIPYDEYKSFV